MLSLLKCHLPTLHRNKKEPTMDFCNIGNVKVCQENKILFLYKESGSGKCGCGEPDLSIDHPHIKEVIEENKLIKQYVKLIKKKC